MDRMMRANLFEVLFEGHLPFPEINIAPENGWLEDQGLC